MNVEVASTAAAGVDNVGTKDVDRAGCITDLNIETRGGHCLKLADLVDKRQKLCTNGFSLGSSSCKHSCNHDASTTQC